MAHFYAQRYPDKLRLVEVPEASAFGQTIKVDRTRSKRDHAVGFPEACA